MVVERCLECHFAAGYDMNKPSLQQEYYEDVVQGLERIEKGFSALNIG